MVPKMTLADIAREAGVSLMTVSRVINNKGDVSPATRTRVQEIIKRKSYRPSGIARSLATRHSGTIGLVIPDVSNPFFADVARGAEHVACTEGYNIFLCNTEEDPHRELDVIYSLEEKRVDGVVLFSRLEFPQLVRSLKHHTAAVLINQLPSKKTAAASIGTVRLDDVLGAQFIVQHLIESGHRAIGCLAGPPTSHSSRSRIEGYTQTMLAAELTPNAFWQRACMPSVEGGQWAAHELLHAQPELTALFCFNDLVAVGALQACAEMGLVVPQDLAVTGYDDIPLAALVTPSLTTCRTPRYDLGAEAVHLLLNQIRGATKKNEDVVLQPQLIIRASAP
jgi:LacI family transcriptional regulator